MDSYHWARCRDCRSSLEKRGFKGMGGETLFYCRHCEEQIEKITGGDPSQGVSNNWPEFREACFAAVAKARAAKARAAATEATPC